MNTNVSTNIDKQTRAEALEAFSKLSSEDINKLIQLNISIIDWYVTRDLISLDVRVAAKEKNPALYQVVVDINSTSTFSYTAISRYHKAIIDIIMAKESYTDIIGTVTFVINDYRDLPPHEILISSFNWSRTNEGRSYWRDLYEKLSVLYL